MIYRLCSDLSGKRQVQMSVHEVANGAMDTLGTEISNDKSLSLWCAFGLALLLCLVQGCTSPSSHEVSRQGAMQLVVQLLQRLKS